MDKRYFILSIICITLFSLNLINAQIESLPPVKSGDCVNLFQSYGNSSYQNISYILVQNSNYSLSTMSINGKMTKHGAFFNYTFCNTSILGHYIVNGIGDVDGYDTAWAYDFYVNGSGQEISSAQINLIIIGMIMLVLVSVFFFVLAVLFKHPGTKVFFMSLSGATIIVLIGIITFNASIYLAEFTGLVEMYNRYYILLTILGSVAMLGIVIWLIYYSLTLFNKTRGRYTEDD